MPKVRVDRGYSFQFFTRGGIAWFFKKGKNTFLGVKMVNFMPISSKIAIYTQN